MNALKVGQETSDVRTMQNWLAFCIESLGIRQTAKMTAHPIATLGKRVKEPWTITLDDVVRLGPFFGLRLALRQENDPPRRGNAEDFQAAQRRASHWNGENFEVPVVNTIDAVNGRRGGNPLGVHSYRQPEPAWARGTE